MIAVDFTWMPITPQRLRAAGRLLRDLRKKGYRFKLDRDRRGFKLRRPPDVSLKDFNAHFDDDIFELRDELTYLLRQEQQRDLRLEP